MLESLLLEIARAMQEPPASALEAACTGRVRVSRAKRTIASRPLTAVPPSPGEVEEVIALLRGNLTGGDQVRVEWLNGTGEPLTGTGVRGAWTVPIPEPTRPASPPPPAPSTFTATAPRTGEIEPEPEPAAPLERAAAASPPPIPAGQEVGAILAAGLGFGASGMKEREAVSRAQLRVIEQQTATIERLAGSLERVATSAIGAQERATVEFAKAHGRTSEALATTAARSSEAVMKTAADVVGTDKEAIGELVGRLEAARDREVELARGQAGQDDDEEDKPRPKGDGPATIEAVTGLLDKGVQVIRSQGKAAAREALGELVNDLAGEADIPAEVLVALKRLSPEQRMKAAGKIAAALA